MKQKNHLRKKISVLYSAIALCVVLMFTPQQMWAFDWTSYTGKSLESIAIDHEEWTPPYTDRIDVGDIPNEDKTVFIYNIRTGKFLQVGGNWGVSASLKDNGMRCWIERVANCNTTCGTKTIYKIHSVYNNYGRNIAGRHVLTANESLSADRGEGVQGEQNELWEWCIEESGTNENQYFIYRPLMVDLADTGITPNGQVFLTNNEQYNNYIFAMHYFDGNDIGPVHYKPIPRQRGTSTASLSISGRNRNTYYNMEDVDQWKFISVSDFNEVMESTNVTNGLTVDCTFLMNDEGFYRTNSYHRYGDDGNGNFKTYTAWNWTAVNSEEAFSALTWNDINDRRHETGFEFVENKMEKTWTNNIGGQGCGDAPEYGRYFCAMMEEPGMLWQEITVPITGWYSISVKGAAAQQGDYLFCANKNDLQGTMRREALLPAEYSTFNAEWTDTPVFGNIEWQRRSGMYLYDEDQHSSTVRIHLEAGETLVFGTLKLSTKDNTDANYRIPYTAVDEFRLTYTDYESFLLDEDANSLDYLYKYSQNTNPQSCYLNRSLKAGNWNTIYLPINLSKAQFEEAFGEGSKLGQLVKGENGALYFDTSIEEDEDGVYLHRGMPYIINVVNDPKIADDEVVAAVNDVEHFDVGEPYYVIKEAMFGEAEYNFAIGAMSRRIAPVRRAANNVPEVLQMSGSYLKQYPEEKGGVGKLPRCYSFSSGKLTFYTKGVSLKGFRAWIVDTEDNGAQAKARFISSDMKWADSNPTSEYTTYVDGVPTLITDNPEEPVYNLRGERMPSGKLPKGVYIKNHKKYIIR